MKSEDILESLKKALEGMDSAVERIIGILTKDVFSNGMLTMIDKTVEVTQTIALLLVTAYWLIGFINEITEVDWRHLSIWWYLKKIIQLILAKALIDLAPDICYGICHFCGWAIKEINLNTNLSSLLTSVNLVEIEKDLDGMNLWGRIWYYMEMMIPKSVITVSSLVVQVIAYLRTISIAIYVMISPICFATVVNKGVSGCYSFLQKFVGTVGQSLIIVIGVNVYKGIVADMLVSSTQGGLGVTMQLTVASIMLMVIIVSAQQFSKMLAGR